MARRGALGGILGLLDLIEEHRGPLEYDWRTRFGLPLAGVGRDMSFGEAWRLVRILLGDPSSQVAAAAMRWEHPWSREAAVLADLFDLTVAANTRKPARDTYPRPWPVTGADARRLGDAAGRTPEQIRAELARRRGGPDGR